MSRPTRAIASIAPLALLLVACGTGDASPTDSAGAGTSTAASQSASEAPSSEGPGASADPGGEEATVTLEGFAFDTDALTITAGTTVSFLNADSAPHTVTEGTDGVAAENPILDAELAGNQNVSINFDEPGIYELTCLFHPDMNMTLTVEG